MGRIFLFDIDGTLVRCAGAGQRAMASAFEVVTGHSLAAFPFDGMTDLAIVRIGLDRAGLVHDASIVATVLAAYLERLPSMLAATAAYCMIDGVLEALAIASAEKRGAVGLGTGNIEHGARCKLEPLGLMRHFAFGGYGCDAERRADLLAAGAKRGAETLGLAADACEVIVIGDTPHDVTAAHAIGARCLAVGTGRYTVPELAEAGADLAVDDLRDAQAHAFLRARPF